MHSNMMLQPLLTSQLLYHAHRHHPDAEIVSRRVEGDIHRYTYEDLAKRCNRLANSLRKLGVRQGDRVGTLAWNGYRHMELYYAVSGSGAIVHTINPRLHSSQIAWIVNHAEDNALFFDLSFLPMVEEIADKVPSVRVFVLMAGRSHCPAQTSIPGLLCYEELLDEAREDFDWPEFDENTAAGLCYTSGTTGNPKGVLYSHRSTVLHAMAGALPDSNNCSSTDALLPVVPMYHVNAWGLPYIACMVGAKLVFPGSKLDGSSLFELIEDEGVTLASGVPTIWKGLLEYVKSSGQRFSTLRGTGIGGSACPEDMIRSFQDDYGVTVMHGWGMTETSPIVTTGRLKRKHAALDSEKKIALLCRQGRAVFGADIKIVDARGREIAWDGVSAGELMVRGHWIVERYFGESMSALVDGWFPTGDIATIDSDGYMRITDRTKDVIKSGGEWISSIELENIAMAHPAIELAACIAKPDPKWDERPLIVAKLKEGHRIDAEELLQFYQGKVAKWWIPDEVCFVETLPLGPTGKLLKSEIRSLVLPSQSLPGIDAAP